MELEEKTITSKRIYDGKVVHLLEDTALLPNGKICTREVIMHPGAVCIAALTDENELLMVRQFRYAFKEELLEIPVGKLEAGEDPKECGIRELREETGAVAKEFEVINKIYPSPGYSNEVIHIYFARDLSFENQQLDDDEFLKVEKIPFDKAVEMVHKGQIKDAKTIIAILGLDFFKTAVIIANR